MAIEVASRQCRVRTDAGGRYGAQQIAARPQPAFSSHIEVISGQLRR